MADAFFTLQEVAAKLNKTEEEVQGLIKEGKLHEYRGEAGDSPEPLFKAVEVEALIADTDIEISEALSGTGELISEDEILLAPEGGEDETAGSDTTAMSGEGISVLGETDEEDYKLADDTMSETKLVPDAGGTLDDTLSSTRSTGEASLEEIEEDVNLDTFGSGSGLLDLSLQADDTSLGGILDEIYTPESEGEGTPAPEASAMEVAAAAEQLMPDEVPAVAPGLEAPVIIQGYAEPAPDAVSNAFGIMLILPILAVVYTIIVTMADDNNMIPVIRTAIQSLIWYVAIGAAVAAGLIVGIAFMMGGSGSKTTAEKKEKKAKEKKAKKEKKPKKEKKKKGKKGKEAAPEEPDSESELA